MEEQTEKMNRETDREYSDTNPESASEREDRTNLQEDTEKTSGNFAQSDNVSDDVKTEAKAEESGAKEKADGGNDDAGNSAKEQSAEEKYARLNDSHLRLMAEFDNFRKRTLREKADLIKSGGATVLTNLLPVIDDFERALNTLHATEDITSVIEGVKLIYGKFTAYLSQQGVKTIDATGQPFDTELFEAIATIPAPEEDMKGKVIDCVQTGYKLYDKVLRHAKVVVGE
ncbi:MAG: nucleotide exchange factor GrpE [Tannerella sp.]|jgi:molecular chaperone GrpE|nr:nucleotide exchange factor GrpE [Tannerella sp.]